ncbi:MAG: hypothetical protein CBR30_08825 [Dictyoglomus sp. NZ13-RE01]|nr:MAG: hypothetical protein CBR30_08825 [Dictyoglomus sp. NZ13-RE01]
MPPPANRYGHRYQYSNNSSNEVEEKGMEKDKKIERIEAALLLLGIIKKLRLPFFRKLNPFQEGGCSL